MLVLMVGVVLTAALAIAFVCSAFILFIILTSKQYKSSTSLLHLQLMVTGVLLSLLFIVFSTPSLLKERWLLHDSSTDEDDDESIYPEEDWESSSFNATENSTSSYDAALALLGDSSWLNDGDDTAVNVSTTPSPLRLNVSSPAVFKTDVVCRLYGFLLVMLHTVAVWVVVGLHCDKYCAIATPLRYNQIVTRRRVAALSSVAWLMGLALATPPLLGSYAYAFSEVVCLPVWHLVDAAAYTWTLATLYVILPFTIMLIVNGRIIVIARHHQHRIFSAIFEVMMSAQATVTHQKNPFDVPKKKRKSVWTVLEQLAAFVVVYYPFFGTIMWEAIQGRPANEYCVLLVTALFVLAPLVNTFVYGIKSKNVRKAVRNYLRKKLYKTEMKHEIQARIPSASNSRRPSITSTLAMPILQKSLQRRMSDYLLQDQMSQPKLVRRSSDMSWHPLEDGTPSPTRLRRPLDTKFPVQSSPAGSHSPASVANFLTVPSFEAARNYYCSQQRVRLSISSLDSDQSFSVKESRTEEENLMITLLPETHSMIEVPTVPHESLIHQQDGTCEAQENISRSRSLQLPLFTLHAKEPSDPYFQDIPNQPDCQTPLLCKTFEVPKRSSSLNSSSPHVMRTLEAILSVRISQSLLRRGSGWGGSQGSMERLSQFLRENRRNTLPANDPSYAPFTLHNADSDEYHDEPQLGTPSNNLEDEDVRVLTFITPLPNGGACLGVCPKDAPREMETTLTVT